MNKKEKGAIFMKIKITGKELKITEAKTTMQKKNQTELINILKNQKQKLL